jgi:hypothetical protein
MGRGYTGASAANVERFGQFDKVHPQRISSPKKDGDLDANSGILALMGGGHGALGFKKLTRHLALISTIELVHGQHLRCHPSRGQYATMLLMLKEIEVVRAGAT